MSHGNVVQVDPGNHLGERTSHEVVAAQLRGEAKTPEESPRAVVRYVAREIEELGLVPDVEELGRRYAGPADVPVSLMERGASA
jgi:hypothetical protein